MRVLFPLPLVLIVLASCQTEEKLNKMQGSASMRTGENIRNASIEGAIISQHTLYPYHFVNGSAQLNALGLRDLSVLVRHFAHSAGEVNLARGDVADALYQSRSQTVATELRTAGIATNRVSIVEGQPGGEGISGARLVKILLNSTALGPAPTAGGAAGGSSSSMTNVQQ